MIKTETRSLLRTLICASFCALSTLIFPLSPVLAQEWRIEPIIRAGAEFDDNADLPRQWAEKYVHQSRSHIYDWLNKHSVGFFPVVHCELFFGKL